MNLLNILLFLPLAAAAVTFIAGSFIKKDNFVKGLAFGLSLLPLLVNLVMLVGYDYSLAAGDFQYATYADWITTLGITYTVGLDGLSMPMVFLTSLLTPLVVLLSFDEHKDLRTYFTLLFLLECGLFGVFSALDFFLFYLFWEVVLIPMYFLILGWGGPRRRYAAIKFFIYTHVASLVMLVGIFAIFFNSASQLGYYTFNMLVISDYVQLPVSLQYLIFPALFFGFAVKIPTVPFHTWLPDAHVEAPTGGSVFLAAVMLKMGGYGLIRIAFGLLPEAAVHYALPMAILGVISMLYAALLALAQDDLKKMIAYSSVSHMGLLLFGLATLQEGAFNGAVLQMFAHGLISAMLFMVCGVLQHSVGTRRIGDLGGVASVLPKLSALTVYAFFASVGLPGLLGFIPELSVFMGAMSVNKPLTMIAMISMIITAAYYLWALERAYFGQPSTDLQEKHPHDLRWFQAVPLLVLGVLVLVLGVYPAPITDMISQSTGYIIDLLGGVQ
jgi:NADH-quinone oxidoreductase subunit M